MASLLKVLFTSFTLACHHILCPEIPCAIIFIVIFMHLTLHMHANSHPCTTQMLTFSRVTLLTSAFCSHPCTTKIFSLLQKNIKKEIKQTN